METEITFDCSKCGEVRKASKMKISNNMEAVIEFTCEKCKKITQVNLQRELVEE